MVVFRVPWLSLPPAGPRPEPRTPTRAARWGGFLDSARGNNSSAAWPREQPPRRPRPLLQAGTGKRGEGHEAASGPGMRQVEHLGAAGWLLQLPQPRSALGWGTRFVPGAASRGFLGSA